MRKLSTDELNRPMPAEYEGQPKRPLVLVLDNIRSMQNVGACFRTADAFALQKIYLCGITAQPPHRDIYRAALGAEQTVPWEYMKDTLSAIRQLKAAGYAILLLEQTTQSLPLQEYRITSQQPLALVVGNEVNGVSEALLPLADVALEIPQWGTKHSLNVSVATGVALWHICTQLPLGEINPA